MTTVSPDDSDVLLLLFGGGTIVVGCGENIIYYWALFCASSFVTCEDFLWFVVWWGGHDARSTAAYRLRIRVVKMWQICCYVKKFNDVA
jgi:hypothetical protein